MCLMLHSRDTRSILIAGLLSAGGFFTVLALGLGSFFLFFPSLPLFYVGLSQNTRIVFFASLAGAATIAIAGYAGAALIYLLMIGLPSAYLSHTSLLHRETATGTQWFPIGQALLNLTLTASVFLAALTALLAMGEQNLPSLLSGYIRAGLEPYRDKFGPEVIMLAESWSFLPLAITLWIWGIGLYVHAWLAARLLATKGQNQRPDMAVEPFSLPVWMISLLGICALASLIGGESMRFLGKSLLITLALPYFFLGFSLIHAASEKWANRRFFLFIIYLMVGLLIWPALFICGHGFLHQLKNLNKSLPER